MLFDPRVDNTLIIWSCFVSLWFSQVVTSHQAQGDSEYLWLRITSNYIHDDDRMIMMIIITWIIANKLKTGLLLAHREVNWPGIGSLYKQTRSGNSESN